MNYTYSLDKCIGNFTDYEAVSCVTQQFPNVMSDIIVFGTIFFLWFVFGLFIRVGKKELLIGQGNYWLLFFFIIIGIILKIFIEYFPIWMMWIN